MVNTPPTAPQLAPPPSPPARAPFTPFAIRLRGLRHQVSEAVKTFSPGGNPDPNTLAKCIATALADIKALEEAAVEVVIESHPGAEPIVQVHKRPH